MKYTSQLWFGLALSICFICTSLWAINPEEEGDRSAAGHSSRIFDQSSNGDRFLLCEPLEPIRMPNQSYLGDRFLLCEPLRMLDLPLPLPVPALKRAKC